MTETRLARPDEIRDVVRTIVRSRRQGSADDVEDQVDGLLALIAQMSRRGAEGHAVTLDNGRPVTACLCLDSPGRVGMLLLPALGPALRDEEALAEAIRCVMEAARGRNLNLLQAILEEGNVREGRLLNRVGFWRLAKLLYMDRRCGRARGEPHAAPVVQWRTYVQENYDVFARTIAQTYEGSLDCPALTGLRDIEEIIASHRATGEHDPRQWFLALVGGEPVGVLLLARVPLRSAIEIVYMGVVPTRRGEGLGVALVGKALEVARQTGTEYVTLAVDANNAPALRVYKRFGFQAIACRYAWIHLLKRAP